MKIRAVRLRDVGLFRDPVAIEGLSGAVDVLAGPNEIGKSTVFRAIEAGFLAKHTTAALAGLLPRSGGEPLIEIDFEAGGRQWRIHKRFGRGRGRMAELTDLAAGRTEAKGAEADERVFELIGHAGTSGARFGLLWVGQDTARLRRAPDDDQRLALSSLIEAEIMAVAGGAELSRVRRRVGDLLDVHTTPANRLRARAHSPYVAALARRREIAEALEAARVAERAMAANLDELEQLRRRHQDLGAATAVRALSEAVSAAETRLADARRAQSLHSEARAKSSEARLKRDALAAFDKLMAELQELSVGAATDRARMAKLGGEVEAAEQAERQAAAAGARLVEEEQRLQARLAARAEADAAAAARAQLEEIEQRLVQARALAATVAAQTRELADCRITPERLGHIEREARAVATLEARIAAAQPTLTIDYLPGREDAILAAGRPVAGGSAIRIDHILELEIAGIGSLRIEPGGSVDLDGDRLDLEAHRGTLAELLAAAGSADPETARKAYGERAAIERGLDSAGTRLTALAPRGVAALAATAADLQSRLASAAAADLPPRAEIEAALEDARRRHTAARRRTEALASETSESRGRLQEQRGAANVRAERLKAVGSALPPESLRAGERARLAAAVEGSDTAAAAAERMAVSLTGSAPTEPDVAQRAAERAAADAALKRHGEDCQALARSIERLEGELEEGFRAGGGRRVQELEGEHERADGEVRRIEDELAALRLLADSLDEAERAERAHYLRPVIDRLEPYLAAVFPSARVGFGEKLDVVSLTRSGTAEAFAELSGGTQEQIAVLVRLAFGRLLAESGAAAPVILDDALVYSDDTRIERLFQVLEDAGRHHQVIVLTCRSRTFDRLGGTRLALTAWRPD